MINKIHQFNYAQGTWTLYNIPQGFPWLPVSLEFEPQNLLNVHQNLQA